MEIWYILPVVKGKPCKKIIKHPSYYDKNNAIIVNSNTHIPKGIITKIIIWLKDVNGIQEISKNRDRYSGLRQLLDIFIRPKIGKSKATKAYFCYDKNFYNNAQWLGEIRTFDN